MRNGVKDKFMREINHLRISVTDRCNFRCTYCMPADLYGERYTFLPKKEILTFEEITRLVQIFVELGVKKIRLTGGEPLMREDIEKLVALLAGIDAIDDLSLTTNAYLLPKKVRALKNAGLHRITVSLDSLDDEVFKKMNGREYSVDRVLNGIAKAEEAGFSPLKINAVVKRGLNDHTLVDLARHFRRTGHIIRFIEYMDVGNLNGWKLDHVVPADEIIERINDVFPLEPVGENYTGEVALRYRYQDGSGEIGVIASVTKPFCGSCTRLRLSTDGKIYTCLFATHGTSLRDNMRNGARDDDLKDMIINTWQIRDDRYSELRSLTTPPKNTPKKIEMYQIGG